MSGKKKRRSGSMFKWYFIQTTVSVLLCLTILSFSVLFFFMRFWKNDMLTALNDDALSVAQGVNLIINDSAESKNNENNSPEELIHQIMMTVAQSSSTEVFLIDESGKILLCHDPKTENQSDSVCMLHRYVRFSKSIIDEIIVSEEECFNYEGKLAGLSEENYLLGSTSVNIQEREYYVVVIQAESIAFLPYTTEFLRIMIFTGIIAVILSFLLSLIVSYRMVRPLKKITEATKHYAGGDFSARINTFDVYNELGQLVDSVNRMADNLAVLEESRSSFVANVSHELKTPMTIISGFVDGILDSTIPQEDENKYLSIVSDEVKRLSRLVVAMLNMSKIEAGKLTLNLSNFSVRDIFIKTVIGFEKYIENKNILIEGLDSLENVILLADETLINQIIYNLIDNAVKFTPNGGIITFSLKEEKKEAVFSVKNTGKGISQEECGLIFDRFYKVDKSRGLDAKSFGMGLYIVRSIIELHKGTIRVNSEENSFVEFIISIPLQ
ncbi:MAG: HAMP domain-containing histidine kinase [Clostridia bacterium]|nr:HAMP domain-containing histidine kinase [Clostridia bacterium]